MEIGTILENDKEHDRGQRYSVVMDSFKDRVQVVGCTGSGWWSGSYLATAVGEDKRVHPVGYVDILGHMRQYIMDAIDECLKNREEEL